MTWALVTAVPVHRSRQSLSLVIVNAVPFSVEVRHLKREFYDTLLVTNGIDRRNVGIGLLFRNNAHHHVRMGREFAIELNQSGQISQFSAKPRILSTELGGFRRL